MSSYYRALLVDAASEYLESHTKKKEESEMLEKICGRLELTPFQKEDPLEGIRDAGSQWKAHVNELSSLILEESRHSISEALHVRWFQSRFQHGHQVYIRFQKNHTQVLGVFDDRALRVTKQFTAKQKNEMLRPGMVAEIHPIVYERGKAKRVHVDQILLGMIRFRVWPPPTKNKKDRMEPLKDKRAVEIFSTSALPTNGQFILHPLASLLTYARQFAAIHVVRPDLFPDLDVVEDAEGAEHVENAENEEDEEDTEDEASHDIKPHPPNTEICRNTAFIPALNERQGVASREFLRSPAGAITLVQGPPGTGKTSLLNSTIWRYLFSFEPSVRNQRPRLMVCAPSNKAITVLASRYLATENCQTPSSPFHMVMVGDEEKLMSENQLLFKDVYVYAWVDNIIQDYKRIVLQSNQSTAALHAKNLANRLAWGLPAYALHEERGVPAAMLDVLKMDGEKRDKALSVVTKRIMEMKRVVIGILLKKANVIFCTLSSSGSSIVRETESVDGLIIDEAAAATEPDTLIPIALRPRRILIVGDPNQLPATVISHLAKTRGLGKSLQERLMFDLNRPHTVLNVQYRMKPEICQFPSSAFYRGEICNGSSVSTRSHKSTLLNLSSLVSDLPYCLVQVDGSIEQRQSSGSFHNVKEAETVVGLLMELKKQTSPKRRNGTPLSLERVRVITFYQAQVRLISATLAANHLEEITVSTVDSSQGSEADLIIVSFVRTGRGSNIGFLSDDRRINVALTRAKHKLICVGDFDGLVKAVGRDSGTMVSLVKDALSRKLVVYKHASKATVFQPTPHQQVWVPRINHIVAAPQANKHIIRSARANTSQKNSTQTEKKKPRSGSTKSDSKKRRQKKQNHDHSHRHAKRRRQGRPG